MKKRTIGYLLTLLILSQSCVVYQKTSVPLEYAVDKGKVKLITTYGEKFKLRYIEKEDSTYYGKLKLSDKVLPIPPAVVDSIFLKDKKKSTLLSWIPVFVVVGLGIFLLIYLYVCPFGC